MSILTVTIRTAMMIRLNGVRSLPVFLFWVLFRVLQALVRMSLARMSRVRMVVKVAVALAALILLSKVIVVSWLMIRLRSVWWRNLAR